MSRDLSATMQAEVVKETIRPVWIVRLDIETDPVQVWTGRGTLVPASTGDAALDGYSFGGLGPIEGISEIKDGPNGSSSVTLSMPGIDLADTALKEIITDSRKWQFRQAWIWLGLLDESYGILANPTRVKTGRMDQISIERGEDIGIVSVTLESYAAYAQNALGSRYIQQKDIDPTDKSQDYVHDLANKQPQVGVPYSSGQYVGGGMSDATSGGFHSQLLLQ